MSTPVKHSANVPAAYSVAPQQTPGGPVPVVGPLGWVLILASGIGLILATWMLYPIDYDGMWAGYRDGVIGTVVLVCGLWLNTSLPARPALAVVALAGVLTILFGVFLDNPTRVFVAELAAGIGMLAGAGLYAAGDRR
jgi:hypothetical protein